MTRIVVFGYGLVGHTCLKTLIEANETIVGVFTHPDAPNEPMWFPSVEKLAKDHGITVIAAESPQDKGVLEALQEMKPDLLFSFFYRKMIPESMLNISSLGSFNMHGSFLPRFRGRAPINWVLVHGETYTGATLHHMVRSADAGEIVDQEEVTISLTDTAFDLTHKVSAAAVQVLLRQLPALKKGMAPSIPQDDAKATYFSGRSAKDSLITWDHSPWQIHNLIRAVPYPYFPPAFTYYKGEKLEIRANQLPEGKSLPRIAHPGQVVDKGEGWIRVACGNGHDYIDVTMLSRPIGDLSVGDVLGT